MLPARRSQGLPKVSVEGGALFVDVVDSYLTAGLKFLAALKFVQDNFQFDFVYRTNTSSYIETGRLRRLAAQSQGASVYAGPIVRTPRGDFVSGSSILLSRDLVAATVQNRSQWPHGLYEDVALGAVMRQLRVSPQETPTCIVSNEAAALALGNQALRNAFHFRCKAVDPSGIRRDASVMRHLDQRLQSLDRSA